MLTLKKQKALVIIVVRGFFCFVFIQLLALNHLGLRGEKAAVRNSITRNGVMCEQMMCPRNENVLARSKQKTMRVILLNQEVISSRITPNRITIKKAKHKNLVLP